MTVDYFLAGFLIIFVSISLVKIIQVIKEEDPRKKR